MSVAKPQTRNIIDTISMGYVALNRRLWVLAIPVALDLYLWLGAPLSFAPLLSSRQPELFALAGLLTADQRQRELLASQIQSADMRAPLAWLNMVPLLPPRMSSHLNSAQVTVGSPAGALLAILLINLLALLVSGLFLAALAGGVCGERFAPGPWLRLALRTMQGIGGVVVIVGGAGLLLGLPFLAISAVLAAAVPAATVAVLLAWYVALFWVYIYVGFAPEAIVIGGASPPRAIYNSVNIVRHNMAAALGLLLLSFVIVAGLGIVWQSIAHRSWGMPAAIIGSAYVGSGLAAARLEFYRQRYLSWQAGKVLRKP